MMTNNFICNYPCPDVKHEMIFPETAIKTDQIKLVMISEAPARLKADYYYTNKEGAFFQTTKTAFEDAGVIVNDYADLTDLGIYLTTAIKCPKIDYLVSAKTIKECALRFLEKELDQFPQLKVIMCMGDFAIKAVNYIYKGKYKKNALPAGSTYKIRKEEHLLDNIRFFPSYTQTGDSFNIEKSKRQMIAEDIQAALDYLRAD